MAKADITKREDIDVLMKSFYGTALRDELIGHHFVEMNLERHLPVIGNFWEKVLLGNPVYFGNPLVVHRALHLKAPLKTEHFSRWIEIFKQTVDRMFEGDIAEHAKKRAEMIAATLDLRLNE
ncbi:MAG: group III truncated hemoglobin [Pyrinomonadaceae bacterium]